MEIRRALLSLLKPIPSGGGTTSQPLPPLQPGQRLEAWVTGRLSNDQILLDVAGRRLVADSHLPLRTGDHLQLEVISLGPQPHLKIVTHSPSAQPTSETLRSALPKQEPVANALRTLQNLGNLSEVRAQLPQSVLSRLDALMQALPSRTVLTQADMLKTAFRQSGLFTESLLGTQASPRLDTPESPDLKTRLLTLATAIEAIRSKPGPGAEGPVRPPPTTPPLPQSKGHPSSPVQAQATNQATLSPLPPSPPRPSLTGTVPTAMRPPTVEKETPPLRKPDPHPQSAGHYAVKEAGGSSFSRYSEHDVLDALSNKVSAAIARILLDQMASLPKADTPTLSWHLELPFRDGDRIDTFRLAIQGEKQRGNEVADKLPWSIDLEMEPPGLGKVHVKLVLQGKTVSGYFWSAESATRRLFEHHLNRLAENFHRAGLQTDRLQTVNSIQPRAPQADIDTPLVDERI